MGVPKSGNGGSVTKGGSTIAHIKKWSLTDTIELLSYVSSTTAGQTKREEGNQDWTASAELYLDDGAKPSIVKGTSYTWVFKLNSSNSFTGTGRVAEISYECDIESGALLSCTVNIEANGGLT